ncbi:MAG: alpha/beta hydrolase [bacterium]|nr:alpha/beta hydrolase [bacterium]
MNNILILHGWGSRAKNWSRVKELLENQGYKVFVPDLPGFGENSPLSRAWAIDDYVEWVSDFCEKNNLSQFFLLGHSFGGGLAIKYTLKYPEKIKKLFLVAPAIRRKKTFKKEILKKLSVFFPKLSFLRKIFYRLLFLKSDYPYVQGGIMKETYLRVIKEDLSDNLSNISISTVIIWGEKDNVTPLKDAYLINKEIKGSKLEIIKGGRHVPNMETPEILAEKIKEFLK